jgi:hypothetical protein
MPSCGQAGRPSRNAPRCPPDRPSPLGMWGTARPWEGRGKTVAPHKPEATHRSRPTEASRALPRSMTSRPTERRAVMPSRFASTGHASTLRPRSAYQKRAALEGLQTQPAAFYHYRSDNKFPPVARCTGNTPTRLSAPYRPKHGDIFAPHRVPLPGRPARPGALWGGEPGGAPFPSPKRQAAQGMHAGGAGPPPPPGLSF